MDVIPKRPDRSAKLDNDVTKPTFTPTLAGTYVLALTVNDGKKDSEADSVTITVNAASTNTAPVAVAGTDQYVPVSSTNKITLTGSGSYDNDTGETATLTYKWYLSRPAADTTAVLSSSTATSPTFYASTAGVYVASLVVTDVNGSASTVSQTRVTASTANSPPLANAGVIQTVSGATPLVTLDGSGSTDADGDTITYAWTIQSAPDLNTVTALTDATTVAPSFTPNTPGVYVIKLIVNDGKVSSAAHTVTITKTD